MDHVDVSDARGVTAAPSVRILYVSLPYSASANAGGTLAPTSPLNFCTAASFPAGFSNCSGVAHNSNANDNSNNSTGSGSGSGAPSAWSPMKPTLDPSQLRVCPEDCWVPDAQVLTCMAHDCNVSFSLFCRKHHCRLCGRLFCAACCSHVITLPNHHTGSSLGYASPCAENAGLFPSQLSTSHRSADKSFGGQLVSFYSFPFSRSSSQPQQPCVSSPTTVAAPPTTTTYRICSSCYYEIQLAIPRRDHAGEVRRKCRGELKMFQWSLLVRVLAYLNMQDLLEASLVSSDFYFISRDNLIWYQYNMAQRQEEEMQWTIPANANSSAFSLNSGFFQRRKQPQTFGTDFGDVASPVTSKSVISLHARYNFTQFLDFARRKEMARCKGLSSFSACAQLLLSSPLKIVIIGPSSVGKTLLVQHYVGPQADGAQSLRGPLPTMSFERYEKTVHVAGALTADVKLHIYDISGETRFEELRRLICSHSHAIGLCYDPQRKNTLLEAANIMMGVEPALGPQPVVVCGIVRDATMSAAVHGLEVTEEHAGGITVRGQGSVQCAWDNGALFFQKLVQSLLDRFVVATSASSRSCLANEKREAMRNRSVAEKLLRITLEPSPLDLLMDLK